MKIQFRIVGVTKDRRSKDLKCRGAAIEQELMDRALDERFQLLVKDNIARRDLHKPVVALLQRQAG